MNKESSHYIPSLDGLRAFAVIFVIIFHSGTPWLIGGWVGVDIFFALSGFLITQSLTLEWNRFGNINLKYFYIRRALRLFPALLFMLFIFGMGVLFFSESKGSYFLDIILSLLYISNWTRALDLKHPDTYLGHTWSLAIEEQFYLLWPLLLIFILRKKSDSPILFLVPLIISVVAALLIRGYLYYRGFSIPRLYNGLDTRADALLIGCSMALLSTYLKDHPFKIKLIQISKAFTIISLILLPILLVYGNSDTAFFFYIGYFLISLLSSLTIFYITQNSLLSKFLSLKPLVYIGKISYGIYLWHYFLICLAVNVFQWRWEFVIIWGITTSIVFAWISYTFIEKPALRLKMQFSR